MKAILIGYPGSQFLIPASRYLVEKYLPFEAHWLNWIGDKDGWSNFVATYLSHLTDEVVILALDDYLVSGFDQEAYQKALKKLEHADCVKLCPNTPEEFREYPVSTQYTLWKRESLIDLLSKTTDPWNFETSGSAVFTGRADIEPCIEYGVHSALSSRWQGVRLDGVKPEDITYLQTHGLI